MYFLPYLLTLLSFEHILLSLATVLRAQTCSRLQPRPTGIADKRLEWYVVSHLLDYSLDRCALECILVRLCASFNYRERLGICELSSVTAEDERLQDMVEFVYHDINNWGWEVAGSCSMRPCNENQRCIRTQPYTCADVDCGPPPNEFVEVSAYKFHLSGIAASTGVGAEAVYSCGSPVASHTFHWNNNIPFYNIPYKICNSDNTWTNNWLTCRLDGLADCVGVNACNPSYPDGHYWVYQEGFFEVKLKVYCHDMATDPKTYITLPPTGNVAYNAGDGITGATSTTFSKIRVDTNFDIHRSDFTFATTKGPAGDVTYGEASSCHGNANNKVYGYFRINTTGTGVWIQASNTWAAATTGGSELINMTYAGGEVSGLCWGQCGTCAPTTTYLRLEENPDDHELCGETAFKSHDRGRWIRHGATYVCLNAYAKDYG